MTHFRGLFIRFLPAVLATLLCVVGIQGALAFSDRQRRAYDMVKLQARDLATLYSQMLEEEVRPPVFYAFLERVTMDGSIHVWLVNDKGMILDARDVNAYNEPPVGVLSREEFDKYLSDALTGEERIVSGAFDDAIVTAIIPISAGGHTRGALMLHKRLDALEQGDLLVVWQQLGLAALGGVAVGLLLLGYAAFRESRPVAALARDVQLVLKGEKAAIEGQQRAELAQIARSVNDMARRIADLGDMRRDFVANVSHELRSPLTSIQGYLQAILDGAVPSGESGRYVAVTLEEARRLSRLVDDLLSLSRVESHSGELETAPFDANELIRRSLAAFAGRLEEQGVEVQLDFQQDKCPAVGNAPLIRQVVDNLIDNSLKHMGQGHRLTLRTRSRSGRIFVSVADDGQGIDKADLPYIFERFYKADKAHASPGTGLGLSIVRSILERHGQAIRASSVPGQGTVMVFTLECAQNDKK